MKGSSYWQKRQQELNNALEKDEKVLKKRLEKYYRTEERRLEKQIASYYTNYGVDNVVEYRQLLQRLSPEDYRLLMEQMDDFGAKYPEYAHLLPVRESIYRLNRLEGLEQSIQMQQLELGIKERSEVEKHLSRQAQRNFSAMTEDLGLKNVQAFNSENKSIIQSVVNTRWCEGKNFSDRIWKNHQKLADKLTKDIAAGFARGDQYSRMVSELKREFAVGRKEAQRLIYTEGTFVQNESRARACENVFEYYSIATVGDERVCDICEGEEIETAGDPVKFEDRVAGENFPPFHPWCRCGYYIVVPDKQKWIDEYVEKHGGDPELDQEQKKAIEKLLDHFVED